MRRTHPIPRNHVRVGKSFAGHGLFATAPIKKGEYIEYIGKLLTDEEADKRGGKYLFELNSRWTIDGTPRSNLARYINHSCKPNCESTTASKRVFIVATKNIAPCTELSYDYGEEYAKDYLNPCRCPAH